MIFVTIGTQAPFDRLLMAMDEVAALITDEEIVAQGIGSNYIPKHMKMVDFLPPDEFDALFAKARVIIGHAGMGTIISALTFQKPLLVMPRIASLGEHRNEHQLATAQKFEKLGYIKWASNEDMLKKMALKLIREEAGASLPIKPTGLFASEQLLKSIKNYISVPNQFLTTSIHLMIIAVQALEALTENSTLTQLIN